MTFVSTCVFQCSSQCILSSVLHSYRILRGAFCGIITPSRGDVRFEPTESKQGGNGHEGAIPNGKERKLVRNRNSFESKEPLGRSRKKPSAIKKSSLVLLNKKESIIGFLSENCGCASSTFYSPFVGSKKKKKSSVWFLYAAIRICRSLPDGLAGSLIKERNDCVFV